MSAFRQQRSYVTFHVLHPYTLSVSVHIMISHRHFSFTPYVMCACVRVWLFAIKIDTVTTFRIVWPVLAECASCVVSMSFSTFIRPFSFNLTHDQSQIDREIHRLQFWNSIHLPKQAIDTISNVITIEQTQFSAQIVERRRKETTKFERNEIVPIF